MSRLEPLARAAYPLVRRVPLRWDDVDIYGHVNNVVYLALFDTAVNGWYVEGGLLDPARSARVFLVVETGAQYFRELRFGEDVEVGIRVTRLGSSSVTYDLGVFGEGDPARARGRFVHVLVDQSTRRPVAIEGPTRTALARLEGEGA